jgi:TfoX/Sxy family transcriptional regulator of competence genes
MAFDQTLAERIRSLLACHKNIDEKRMFGGIAFLVNGNMTICVSKDSLIVRLGPDQSHEAVNEPHVRPLQMSGRTLKGWIRVARAGVETDEQLTGVVQRALKFVRKLRAK